MITRLIITLFLVFNIGCKEESTDIKLCFEILRNNIGEESILKKIMNSSLDSYREFSPIISTALARESNINSKCGEALNKYRLDNKENSITVNNLIFFQHFQAYLKGEIFDKKIAQSKAIAFEQKWK